jgi:hypothetical protein
MSLAFRNTTVNSTRFFRALHGFSTAVRKFAAPPPTFSAIRDLVVTKSFASPFHLSSPAKIWHSFQSYPANTSIVFISTAIHFHPCSDFVRAVRQIRRAIPARLGSGPATS